MPTRRLRAVDRNSPFYVSPTVDLFGALVHRHRGFLVKLGRVETQLLEEPLSAVRITMPIYVCGLARAGTTLLHEIVAAHPGVASHRVKDYPLVYTPYWWRQATARRPSTPPRERAHGDRMTISSESPEALEEMVWMAFFPRCHDPSRSNVLSAADRHRDFETFYPAHIRKLMLAEKATRYAAKANYHVARMAYLLHLFPDARFILPVREPASHIVSLMRQHERFSEGERHYPRALAYMQRSGHFEFGLDRRPVHVGDCKRIRSIQKAWAGGEEVRGWARYWGLIYDYLAGLLASNDRLRAATLVVRYEDMCERPAEIIGAVLRHCGLSETQRLLEQFAPRVNRPDYYRSPLTPADRAIIHEEAAASAARWGYTEAGAK